MSGRSRSGPDERAFEALLAFVEAELDFETEYYNDEYLDRRITARLRRTDADGYRAYRRLLEDDPEEREALLDSMSINVTGFFRNPEAWERLREVLAELTDRSRSVEVWSVPSADGREPYSVAMLALDDPAIRHERLSITGADINAEVLAAARRGVYETTQTTDIAAELAPVAGEQYVDREDDQFAVRDRVKRMVEFERHDLIRGDPKPGVDLLLCRNFLIYIDPAYKERIFETIRTSLAAGGYLVIGATETLPADTRPAFDPISKRHRIYQHEPRQ